MERVSIYKRLAHYLAPYKGKVMLTLLTSICVGALSTSPVPLVQQTFDKIFVEKDYFMLKMLPLIVIALYVAKGGLRYLQSVIIYQIGWELVARIRQEMFEHIHKLPYGFFEKDTTGQLMSRLVNDVNAMLLSLTKYIKDTIQNVVMFIGLLFWVFWLKWDWALIAIFIIPIAILPTATVARKLRKLGRRGQELLADINSTMLESISGIKVVRAFGLEEQENKKLHKHNDDFLDIMKKDVRYTEFTSPMMEVLAVLGGAAVLWLGGLQVLEGEISQGSFFAFVLGMFMMYDPMRILFKTYTDSQKAVAAAERVFSILDTEEEKAKDGTIELKEFNDRIEYRNVCFKYPTRDTMVLKDINLTVKKSEVLAIVGMSGAGKTTLVDLLFKFFTVTQGEILVDGVNINDITAQSLRRNLALVTQETFLFNDTVWANIGYGNPNATREDIVRAAKAAHVDTYVQALDDGYDTVIGERGLKLSGGQRQRIAIARAIVRNAPILVLDEATSALDSESEKLVQDALNNLMEHRTTFVIAHRFSTIKHADRIIVLEHGEMVGQGNHEQLLEQCPQYQKYYEMQIIGSA
ncbi:ABC transporter ATP-binding protein [Nitrospina gracilis]|uniref:ABC transporter ATP-binding protein n=1 Tax=Nitrospina gracilis TaxID=35801 RepID=UPI001F385C5B|nr:ABC transporter ATP-binding protein [Nitrospina gracilis]MCF8720743.1 subfamily B ATP-binding cassette protein MsbA [Nitrospina gracilis Nb-211]